MDPMTNELRRVMVMLALEAARLRDLDAGRSWGNCLSVFNFAAFGGNVGLITADEVADWKAVSQWRKDLPEVMERWQGTTVVHGSTQS